MTSFITELPHLWKRTLADLQALRAVGWLLEARWRELFPGERRALKGRRCFPDELWLGQEDLCANWSRSQDSSIPGTGANRCDTTACRNSEKDDQSGSKCLIDLPVLGTGMGLGSPGRFYRCHFQQIDPIWPRTYQRGNSLTWCIFILLFTQVSSELSSSSLFLTFTVWAVSFSHFLAASCGE